MKDRLNALTREKRREAKKSICELLDIKPRTLANYVYGRTKTPKYLERVIDNIIKSYEK